MLQDSSRNWGIPVFVESKKVSFNFGNSVSHNSLYTSLEKEFVQVEAPMRHEIRFFYFLRLFLIMIANGVLSAPVFLWHFPGAFASWVERSIKAYFSEQSQGKPDSCSPKR
jgi:hypothetical protein